VDTTTASYYTILSFNPNYIVSQSLSNSQNLAVHGYHSKDTNSYSLMSSTLPLLAEEKYSPFLITKGFYYNITTQSIKDLLSGYKAEIKYRRTKQIISNMIILPGFIFALMYIANAFALLDQIPLLYTIAQSWIADFTFWLSMLGVMLLWHEYFRKRTHPIKFSPTERFSHKELTNIEIAGVRFEKYKKLQATQFLNFETKEFLFNASKGNYIDTYILLSLLLKDPNIKSVIKRSGLNLSKKFFKQKEITNKTFPKYPIESLRSLTIYALEEAIITGDTNIKPIHLFLSMTRIYPALRKFITSNDNTIEVIREATNFEINKQKDVSFFDRFNIQKTYYPSGGLGHKWIYTFSEKSKKYLEDITVSLTDTKEVFGIAREEIIKEVTSIVDRKEKNKVLLIGAKGVGKSSIINAIAQQINWGKLPKSFRGRRLIKIGSDFIVNTSPKVPTKYFAKILEGLEKRTKNIYYIDNLVSIITPRDGRKNLNETQQMLIEFIKKIKSPVISTINYFEYQNIFKNEDSLEDIFQTLEISNTSKADTLSIIEQKVPHFEELYNIYITIPSLIVIIDLAYQLDKHENNSVNGPKAAVQLLEKTIQKAIENKVKVLDANASSKYAPKLTYKKSDLDKPNTDQIKINVPNKPVSISEATSNIQLAEKIKHKIIGRNEEIDQIAKFFQSSQDKSSLNFHKVLLGGPTGAGKTHLAKTFALEIIGKEPMIVIDLEKYQHVSDIQKYLHKYARQLKDTNKYYISGVIFLDKIEFTTPSTYEFILELLSQGKVPGQYRRQYIFRECLLFATTLIGSEFLGNTIEKNKFENSSLSAEDRQRALLAMRSKINHDLIDTFDYISMLSPYSIVEISKIIELELVSFAQLFLEKDFNLVWDKSVPQMLGNRIQNDKTDFTEIKQIIHDITNTLILEKVRKDSDTNVKRKEVKISPSSLNDYFKLK
jgi:ATP-dependent Clp protease ATP-binding subunit ClpA